MRCPVDELERNTITKLCHYKVNCVSFNPLIHTQTVTKIWLGIVGKLVYRRHIILYPMYSNAHKTMNRTATTQNRFGNHEFIFIHAFKTGSFIIYFQVKQRYILVQLQCGLLPTTAYLLNSKSLQHKSAWLLQMPQTIPKKCIRHLFLT